MNAALCIRHDLLCFWLESFGQSLQHARGFITLNGVSTGREADQHDGGVRFEPGLDKVLQLVDFRRDAQTGTSECMDAWSEKHVFQTRQTCYNYQ